MTKEDVNSTYSLGNLTVCDLAREFGVSTRTIHRYLSSEYKENLPKLVYSNVVVLMDATYWGRRFGVVIMKDHISGRVLWYKFIDKKETIADYREGISYLDLHGYNVLGIVSDGLKGLRQEFHQYRFQHCQFHQLMTIRAKLTLHPKLQASQDLLGIAKILCHTDKDSFIGALTAWHTPVRDKDLLRKVPIAYSFQCARAVPRAYSRRNNMQPMRTEIHEKVMYGAMA